MSCLNSLRRGRPLEPTHSLCSYRRGQIRTFRNGWGKFRSIVHKVVVVKYLDPMLEQTLGHDVHRLLLLEHGEVFRVILSLGQVVNVVQVAALQGRVRRADQRRRRHSGPFFASRRDDQKNLFETRQALKNNQRSPFQNDKFKIKNSDANVLAEFVLSCSLTRSCKTFGHRLAP